MVEVGMYVRTDNGIAKYLGPGINVLKDDGSSSYKHWKSKHLFDNYIFDEEYGDSLTTLDNIDKKIVGNPSYNIIDLIEIGDYVNGSIVDDFYTTYNEEADSIVRKGVITNDCYLENSLNSWLEEKDIKSIVTKEQFESLMYEVK